MSRFTAVIALALVCCPSVSRGEKTVRFSDASAFHVQEAGEGDSIIFVHGLMSDARVWSRQLDAFADRGFRAIAYSRRFNFPNRNRPMSNYSAAVDAEDLGALLTRLGIQRAHVVSHSYGAYSALIFALNNPDRIRSLTLAEPPLVSLLDDAQVVGAEAAKQDLDRLYERFIKPAKAAAKSGGDDLLLRKFFDYFAGAGRFDRLPPAVVRNARQNLPELRSFLVSNERYPVLDRGKLESVDFPVLVISGENTKSLAQYTDQELLHCLPEATTHSVIIPNASHLMWTEQPVASRNAVLNFLDTLDGEG